jgi:hypothetical protein
MGKLLVNADQTPLGFSYSVEALLCCSAALPQSQRAARQLHHLQP